jgi:hypothetical protein
MKVPKPIDRSIQKRIQVTRTMSISVEEPLFCMDGIGELFSFLTFGQTAVPSICQPQAQGEIEPFHIHFRKLSRLVRMIKDEVFDKKSSIWLKTREYVKISLSSE